MPQTLTLINKILSERVVQTMTLMSSCKPALIDALANHVVFKKKGTDFGEFTASTIYRAKKNLKSNQEKLIKLSGLHSSFYAREKGAEEQDLFAIIVSFNPEDLRQGRLWFSPDKNKAFMTSELTFFFMDESGFHPYTMNGSV